jgi:hypothetical protein
MKMPIDSEENIPIYDKKLDELQSKLKPVWRFNPWFIVRIQVPYLLYLMRHGNLTPPKKPFSKTIHFSHFPRLVKTICSIFVWRIKNKHKFINHVVIAGYRQHQIDHNTKKINPYTEPFRQLSEDAQQPTITFYFEGPAENDPKSFEVYRYFKYLSFYHKFRLRFEIRFSSFARHQLLKLEENEKLLNGWADKLSQEDANNISSTVSHAVLRNELLFRVFSDICRVVQPKFIWSYCFYDNDTSAFARAARAQNIRFVDYQHSQQSNTHLVYSPWVGIDSVYDFFPSTFWVWRASDGRRISENFLGKRYHPEVLVGGNIAVAQYKISPRRNGCQKSILVSLQGAWLPEFIVKFIALDERYLWYLRLHPRYPTDREKAVALKIKFPDRVRLEEANDMSLYDLLCMVSFNITAYSGVALEADIFGVKNVIFSEKGYETYRDYIEGGIFAFAFDHNSLSEALNGEYIKNESDPIIVDYSVINKSVNELLK